MPSKGRGGFLPVLKAKPDAKPEDSVLSSSTKSIPYLSGEFSSNLGSSFQSNSENGGTIPFRCSAPPPDRKSSDRGSILGPREQKLLRQILANEPGWLITGLSSSDSGKIKHVNDIPNPASFVQLDIAPTVPEPIVFDAPSRIFLERDVSIEPFFLFPREECETIRYSVYPPLPSGLSLDAKTGMITGTPTVATCDTVSSLPKIDTWTITARDTASNGAARVVRTRFIVLDPPGKLEYQSVFSIYQVGVSIQPNAPIAMTGTSLTYTTEPPLPEGLSIDRATGCIQGTPLEVTGATMFECTASNALGSSSVLIAMEVQPTVGPFHYPNASITSLVGTPIQETVPDVGNRSEKTRFEVIPKLPRGLELDRRTGAIRGAPAEPTCEVVHFALRGHTHAFHAHRLPHTVRCSNSVSDALAHLSVSVLEPPRLQATVTAVTYLLGKCATPVMFTGPAGPGLRFHASPRLPRGLFLNAATGTLSGIPSEICMDGSRFTIAADDGQGTVVDAMRLTIMIGVLDHPHSFAYRMPAAVYCVGRRQLFADVDAFLRQVRLDWSRFHVRTAVLMQRNFRRKALRTYLRRRLRDWRDVVRTAAAVAEEIYGRWRRLTKRQNLVHRLRERPPQEDSDEPLAALKTSLLETQARQQPNQALSMITLAPAAGGPQWSRPNFKYLADLHADELRRPASTRRARPAEERMNHMGRAGRRGCGKGNWIQSLQGGGPWVFAVDPPLPPGLEVDRKTGCITGTPLKATPLATYTVTASNKIGSVSATLRLEVLLPPVPPSMPEYESGHALAAPVNKAVASCVVNRCGTGPFRYTCLPALPQGMRMDEATGDVSGLCRCPQDLEITVFCENVAGIASSTLRIVVEKEPEFLRYWNCQKYRNNEDEEDREDIPSLVFAQGVKVDECRLQIWKSQPLYWEKIRRKGLNETDLRRFRWYLISRPIRHFVARLFPLAGTHSRFWAEPELPRGLVVDPKYGGISGTPEELISPPRSYQIFAKNSVGMASCTIRIECLLPPTPPIYDVGQDGVLHYLEGEEIFLPPPELTGSPPFTFSVYPELPGQLRINADGSISGKVPMVAPLFFTNFSVKVKNLVGKSFGKFVLAPESCVFGCLMDTSRACTLSKRVGILLTRCEKKVRRDKSQVEGVKKSFRGDPTVESPRRAEHFERKEISNFLARHEVELRDRARVVCETGFFSLKSDPGWHQMHIVPEGESFEGSFIFVDFSPYQLVDPTRVPIAPQSDYADSDLTDASDATTIKSVGGAGALISQPIPEERGMNTTTLPEQLSIQPGRKYPICVLYSPYLKPGNMRVILTWNVAAFQGVEMKLRVWASWGDQCTAGSPRCTDPDKVCSVELMESTALPQKFPIVCQLQGINKGDFIFSISVSQVVAQSRPSRQDQKALAKRADAKRQFLTEVASSAAEHNVRYHSKPSVENARMGTKVYVLGFGTSYCFEPSKDGFIRNGTWHCCSINGMEGTCTMSRDSGKAVTAVESMIEEENVVKAFKLWNQLKEDGGSEEELVRLKSAINACRKKVVKRGDDMVEASKAALAKLDFRVAIDRWNDARQLYVNAGVCTPTMVFGRSKAKRFDTNDIEQGVGQKYMEALTEVNLAIVRLQNMCHIKQNLLHRVTTLCFDLWFDMVDHAKRLRAFSVKIVKRWLSGAIQPAFQSMKWLAQRKKRVQQCIAKMKHMMMTRIVGQWRMVYEECAEARAEERARVEAAFLNGVQKLKAAEEIKKGKFYLDGECFDSLFQVELKADWFMSTVQHPRTEMHTWGFNLPFVRAMTDDSEVLPSHLDFEIFETAASKICENKKIQGIYAANIAQSLYMSACDWLQRRSRVETKLNVKGVLEVVTEGMKQLQGAKAAEIDDPQLIELVNGLAGHVREAESGFRKQLYEALEMQRKICQKADRALQDADNCLKCMDFQGAKRKIEESKKEIEKAAAWELKPSIRSCFTRSHAAYVIIRSFRNSRKVRKPTYLGILAAMEEMTAIEIIQANKRAHSYKQEAEECLEKGTPKQGYDLVHRARELWNDRKLFSVEDAEIRESLQHLDHLWKSLEKIHQLAEQGKAELSAAEAHGAAQTLVDARECLEEARRLLAEGNALQHYQSRVDEVEAAIVQRERSVCKHGLHLLQEAALAVSQGGGNWAQGQMLHSQALDVFAKVGGANRARAISGFGPQYVLRFVMVEGVPVREDKLTPQAIAAMSDEERAALTEMQEADECVPADGYAGEEEPNLPTPLPGTTPTVGVGVQAVLQRNGRPARLDPEADGCVFLPRFESMDDVAIWRLGLLRDGFATCSRYQEAATLLVADADRNISCFIFEVAQRQLAAAAEYLRRAYTDASHLDATMKKIFEQVLVALDEGRWLLQESHRLLGDLDAVPDPATVTTTRKLLPPPESDAADAAVQASSLVAGGGHDPRRLSHDAAFDRRSQQGSRASAAEQYSEDFASTTSVGDRRMSAEDEHTEEFGHLGDGSMIDQPSFCDSESDAHVLAAGIAEQPSFLAPDPDPLLWDHPDATDAGAERMPAPPPPIAAEHSADKGRKQPIETAAAVAADAAAAGEQVAADAAGEVGGLVLTGEGFVWEAKETLQRARFLLAAVGSYAMGEREAADVRAQTADADALQARIGRILSSMLQRDQSVLVRLEYPTARMELVCGTPAEINEPLLNGRSPADHSWAAGPGGPLRFIVEPPLFPGLRLDPATGALSGVPEVAGGGRFVVTCTNAFGPVRAAVAVAVRPDNSYGLRMETSGLPLMARVQRLIDLGLPDEAEAERRREMRRRLARFRGPYPRAYDMHRGQGAGGGSAAVSPRRRGSRDGGVGGDFQGMVSPEDSLDRTRLQTMFKEYRLY